MNKAKDVIQEADRPRVMFGYVSIVELSKELFRGGLLLTDLRGKPQDFRCTSAIKPNAIQRVLYGGTLTEHMLLDLCGLPLLNALQKKPNVLAANRPDLLALRAETTLPMLWLRRQGDTQHSSPLADQECELVASEAGLFDTVLASCAGGHGEDMALAVEWIREIGRSIDPMEPFTRIEAALKLVQDKAGAR